MEIRLEHTEGLGLMAEVWIGGHLLKVCDCVSLPSQPCRPGQLENVKFSYASIEGFSWNDAARLNPSEKTSIDSQRGWGYVGFGRIVQVMPVVIDFGLIRMEDANWTNDENLVGKFVRISIDRLEIQRAEEPDWPADAKMQKLHNF